jgi:hypothetical protein
MYRKAREASKMGKKEEAMRKAGKKEVHPDLDGKGYEQHFFIYVNEGGFRSYWSLKESADTEEEATRIAKKYIHLGDVKIKVSYERVVSVLPRQGICT